MSKREKIAYFLLLPSLVIYGLFFVYPNISLLSLSLLRWDGISPDKFFVGIDNYRRLFLDDPIWLKALINTSLVALQSIFIQLPIGLALAIILTRVRGGEIFSSIIFLPLVVSLVAIGMVWTWMYDAEFGLVNQVLSLLGLDRLTRAWVGDSRTALLSVLVVINWIYIGLYMVMFTAGLRTISQSIFDAAKVDGLSQLQTAWRITVPLLKPVIAVMVMMAISGSFKSFDLIWIITGGGPAHATEIASTHLYRMAYRRMESGYASAIGVLIFLICLAATIAQLRIMRVRGSK